MLNKNKSIFQIISENYIFNTGFSVWNSWENQVFWVLAHPIHRMKAIKNVIFYNKARLIRIAFGLERITLSSWFLSVRIPLRFSDKNGHTFTTTL